MFVILPSLTSGLQTLTYLQCQMNADHMLVIYLFYHILKTTTIEILIIELLSESQSELCRLCDTHFCSLFFQIRLTLRLLLDITSWTTNAAVACGRQWWRLNFCCRIYSVRGMKCHYRYWFTSMVLSLCVSCSWDIRVQLPGIGSM